MAVIPALSIKKIRNLLGLNQTQFVRDVMGGSISRSTLVKWEREGAPETSSLKEKVLAHLKKVPATHPEEILSLAALLGSSPKTSAPETSAKCPHCQCSVKLGSNAPEGRWFCSSCDNEFRFTSDRRAVRIARAS